MTKPTIPSTLDELMDLDPLALSKSPEALDAIIDYHRKRRAERAAGGPRRAKKDTGPTTSLSGVVAGLIGHKSAGPAIKRRV